MIVEHTIDEMSDDKLALAVILSHVCMALAHLYNSGIKDNKDINGAIEFLVPIVRFKCESDEAFYQIIEMARAEVSKKDVVLN